MPAVGSLGRAAGAAVGVRVARNDIGERKLPAHRDQPPRERYRVAATLAPVHADNDVFEHPGSSELRVYLSGDGPTVRAGVRSRVSLASLIAVCPALTLTLVGGAP